MGGQSDQTAEEKKQGSRKEQRQVTKDRNNMDREVGVDRGGGLNMQSKMQCAVMAQNEDDAEQRHRDMRMLMLTKQKADRVYQAACRVEIENVCEDEFGRFGGTGQLRD